MKLILQYCQVMWIVAKALLGLIQYIALNQSQELCQSIVFMILKGFLMNLSYQMLVLIHPKQIFSFIEDHFSNSMLIDQAI